MRKLIVILYLLVSSLAYSQPFIEEINAFKKQDSISFPAANQILFVGSSSFTMWKDVQDYFPGYKVLNRGFGGSSLLDVIRYADKIIFPYKPKQIVIYCGENDIAGDTTVTGKMVFERFLQLYNSIRNNHGNVSIAYISMKPSPSRWHLKEKFADGNTRIKKFLKKRKNNGSYINVWEAMLDTHRKPNTTLFLQDNLHMNKDGYDIWKKILKPYLLK